MLVLEAALLSSLIDRVDPRKILDFGSGSRADRTIIQPHIGAAYSGYDVVWTDATPSKGVVYCDLMRPETVRALPKCELVTACSVLEHVTDIDKAIEALTSVVDRWMIVSVPCSYPEHHCPIDNLWRPLPHELASRIDSYGLVTEEMYTTGPETFMGVENASASVVLARKR